jgi:hypothetical protein
LTKVQDAHNRHRCRDWNGSEPWACGGCDCTERLERRLKEQGQPFLEALTGLVRNPTSIDANVREDRREQDRTDSSRLPVLSSQV